MPSDFHDAAWLALPEDATPGDFGLRRGFLLDRVSAGQRVLDVGCGTGAFAADLAAAGAGVVGVDVSAEALRRARAAHPELDLHEVAPGQPLPFEDAGFDVVWAGDVLTHVLDLAGLLSELRRVLRPEGRLLVTAPDHSPRALLALALWTRRFADQFDPRSQHVRFFNGHSLRELLEDLGFAEVDVRARKSTLLATAVRPVLRRAD